MQNLTQNATEAAGRAAEALLPASSDLAVNATRTPLAPDAVQTLGTTPVAGSGSNILDAGQSLFGTTLTTASYLFMILGVLLLAFWLLRRYGPSGMARMTGQDNPKLIGRLALGPKQHVSVVRIHGRNLVLGVTEDRINLLAETETPAGHCYEEEDEDDFTRFAEMLGKGGNADSAAGEPDSADKGETGNKAGPAAKSGDSA